MQFILLHSHTMKRHLDKVSEDELSDSSSSSSDSAPQISKKKKKNKRQRRDDGSDDEYVKLASGGRVRVSGHSNDLLGRLEQVKKSYALQPGEGFFELDKRDTIVAAANERWTRNDGTVMNKTTGREKDTELYGETYRNLDHQMAKPVHDDAIVGFMRMLSGHLKKRDVMELFNDEGILNLQRQDEERREWNKLERNRIMVPAETKEKQLKLLEERIVKGNERIAGIRETIGRLNRIFPMIESIGTYTGTQRSLVGIPLAVHICLQYRLYETMRKIALTGTNDTAIIVDAAGHFNHFVQLFDGFHSNVNDVTSKAPVQSYTLMIIADSLLGTARVHAEASGGVSLKIFTNFVLEWSWYFLVRDYFMEEENSFYNIDVSAKQGKIEYSNSKISETSISKYLLRTLAYTYRIHDATVTNIKGIFDNWQDSTIVVLNSQWNKTIKMSEGDIKDEAERGNVNIIDPNPRKNPVRVVENHTTASLDVTIQTDVVAMADMKDMYRDAMQLKDNNYWFATDDVNAHWKLFQESITSAYVNPSNSLGKWNHVASKFLKLNTEPMQRELLLYGIAEYLTILILGEGTNASDPDLFTFENNVTVVGELAEYFTKYRKYLLFFLLADIIHSACLRNGYSDDTKLNIQTPIRGSSRGVLILKQSAARGMNTDMPLFEQFARFFLENEEYPDIKDSKIMKAQFYDDHRSLSDIVISLPIDNTYISTIKTVLQELASIKSEEDLKHILKSLPMTRIWCQSNVIRRNWTKFRAINPKEALGVVKSLDYVGLDYSDILLTLYLRQTSEFCLYLLYTLLMGETWRIASVNYGPPIADLIKRVPVAYRDYTNDARRKNGEILKSDTLRALDTQLTVIIQQTQMIYPITFTDDELTLVETLTNAYFDINPGVSLINETHYGTLEARFAMYILPRQLRAFISVLTSHVLPRHVSEQALYAKTLEDTRTEALRLMKGDRASIKDQEDNISSLYVPDARYQMQPRFTGLFWIADEFVACIEEAYSQLMRIEGLADATLDMLIRAPVASGLPGAFARFVATFSNKLNLTFPDQYNKDIQHKLEKEQRKAAFNALCEYAIQNSGYGLSVVRTLTSDSRVRTKTTAYTDAVVLKALALTSSMVTTSYTRPMITY